MLTNLLYSQKVLLSLLGVGNTGKIIDEFTLTFVSITIVFLVLSCLIAIYILIGWLVNRKSACPQNDATSDTEVEDDFHDKESYIITIKRRTAGEGDIAEKLEINPQRAGETPEGNKPETGGKSTAKKEYAIKSPLPGQVTDVKVKEGDEVKEGQVLAVIEAMKMENEIEAETGGIVKAVHIAKGDTVLEGKIIFVIE